MYTRVAPEKKPDQTYGGISASKKKPTAPVKSARRPNVRSKDYRMLVYLISNNPDYITQDEYALLQRTIGNQATIKLIHEAKERKRLKKLGQTPMSGNSQPVRNKNNEINKKTSKEIHQEDNKETNNKTMQLRSQGKNPGTKSDTSDKKNGQANQGRLSTTKLRLPEALRNKFEEISGISLSDVKVHENSDKPQQLGAHAFTQGNEIHLAPGQEEHLPHEGWHAVQQKQGRVQPTLQMKPNEALNDDDQLEKEADVMGREAAKESFISEIQIKENPREVSNQHNDKVIQKKADKNKRKIRLYEPKSGAVAEVDAQNTQTIDLLLSKGYKNLSTKDEKENWVLKVGHRNINDDVVVLQKFLVSSRYLNMPISSSTNKRVPFGTYGELTKQAVMNFQEKKGLKPDGIVGPDTWKAALLPWNKESNEPDRHNHQYLIILSNKNILDDEKKEDKKPKGDINYLANIKSNLYILGYHNVYKDYKAARNQFLKEFFDKGHSLHADFIRMGNGEHDSSLLAWTDRALSGEITRNKKESQGTGKDKPLDANILLDINKLFSMGAHERIELVTEICNSFNSSNSTATEIRLVNAIGAVIIAYSRPDEIVEHINSLLLFQFNLGPNKTDPEMAKAFADVFTLYLTGKAFEGIKLPSKGASKSIFKNIDEGLNFASTPAKHMENPGRFVPTQTLQDAIKSTKGVADPRGSNAMMHYTTMTKNGQTYNLEVLYDKATNTVYHFEYTRKAIGNLPAIPK